MGIAAGRLDVSPVHGPALQVGPQLGDGGALDRGELAAHDAVPSEKRLQQEHGVARETARHAIRLLREEGYVYTLSTRGTYVSPRD